MNNLDLSLFNAYGIEAEYMIVDCESLSVSASASLVLADDKGTIQNEITFEKTAWSNELASHLIEIKTNGPVNHLDDVEKIFHKDILKLNSLLKAKNLMLMPTAMHPWMNPSEEFIIWEHENQEIYNAYDKIFNCKGHGWSNLQSVHINLGYANESEFLSLHSAIRILLPLIPALAASSPILEQRKSDFLDTRLNFYMNNQKIIPEISGSIIPEVILNEAEYRKLILKPMYDAVAKYDTEGLLQDEWLNSRGAIARFDRSAIEIRLMDIQECPKADLSLVRIFVQFLKHLMNNCSIQDMNSITTQDLKEILDLTIVHGTKSDITNSKLLKILGFDSSCLSILEIFFRIPGVQSNDKLMLEIIKDHGNLSERILSSIVLDNSLKFSHPKSRTENSLLSKSSLNKTYHKLCDCLANNEIYIPS